MRRLLGVPTLPVLTGYSDLVLPPNGAQRHLPRLLVLTALGVCSFMGFILGFKDGELSSIVSAQASNLDSQSFYGFHLLHKRSSITQTTWASSVILVSTQ